MQKRKAIYIFCFLALCVACFVILKSLVLENCLAFDGNDDAVHTFVNHFVAQNILRGGNLPLMNLYNNFGTPLLGDALTYPFAFHSLTYWFLPFGIAMTANRFILAFLTVASLGYYYRNKLSPFSACVAALLVMFNPGFIWHFANHHYQASIFCCVLVLIFQEELLKSGRSKYFVGLCIAFVCLFLSASFNLTVIILMFVFLNQLIIDKGRVTKRIFLLGLAATSGFLFYFSDTLYMFQLIALSERVVQWYRTSDHLSYALQFSTIVVAVMVGGIVLSSRKKGGKRIFWQVILLGCIPFVLVHILRIFPMIWQSVPFLMSVDISRFLWIAMIFVALGVGKGLDGFVQQKKVLRKTSRKFVEIIFLGLGILCVSSQFTLIAKRVLGYDNFRQCNDAIHFSDRGSDLFYPQEFMEDIERDSRMAAEFISWGGMDLKPARYSILGSGGRSVFVNKALGDYLIANDLIRVDQSPFSYHFKGPWDETKLSPFGIKYIVQYEMPGKEKPQGWRLVRKAEGFSWYLYENPMKPSLAYLEVNDQVQFIDPQKIHLKGNSVDVELPLLSQSQDVVITFIDIPGWTALISEEETKIRHEENQLMRVRVNPGDQKVVFEFKPYPRIYFPAGILMSLAVCLIVFVNLRFFNLQK